jgi:hypothetical protein
MMEDRAMPKPRFQVSHPAQTEFKVLGGQRPSGANALAKAALEAAHGKVAAAEVRRAARQAQREQTRTSA